MIIAFVIQTREPFLLILHEADNVYYVSVPDAYTKKVSFKETSNCEEFTISYLLKMFPLLVTNFIFVANNYFIILHICFLLI